MPDLIGMTTADCIATARRTGVAGNEVAAEIYRRTWATGRHEPEAVFRRPDRVAAWLACFTWTPPALVDEIIEDGPAGRTRRFVLALADGARVECVLLPMGRGRYHLCLSSQVGCRFACTFCATGRGGWIRQMSATEIVGQVAAARAITGTLPHRLVFMGMGEPLDNLDSLLDALAVLTDRRGPGYAQDGITVCTVGLVPGIQRLRDLGWKRLDLAVSLHAADPALRARLLPGRAGADLTELQAALAAYPQRRNFCLSINYCQLPGVNDRDEDIAALAEFCAPLGRVLIHVIPHNPVDATGCAPTEPQSAAFVERLRTAGLKVRRRVAKGAAIAAACGQLAGAGRKVSSLSSANRV